MDTDHWIIQQLVQKDEAALRLLMERYGDVIVRTAYMLTRDRMLAEDISQETFLSAYQKAGQYNGEGKLKSWLLKIMLNHCRSRMRKAAWRGLFFRDIQDYELVSDERGPEQSAVEKELSAELTRLPYKYREVIILYYYHDLSVKEISEYLQDKEGTVKSKLSRGRILLKDILVKGEWQYEA
jgi:RNA polymerase sigma-70 factor (ECF subfamily)